MNKVVGTELLPLLNQMYKQQLISSKERDEFCHLLRKAVSVDSQFYRALSLKLNALSQEGRTQQEQYLLNKATQLLTSIA